MSLRELLSNNKDKLKRIFPGMVFLVDKGNK